jgi:imidazolonepropionase-like amidohydrolase
VWGKLLEELVLEPRVVACVPGLRREEVAMLAGVSVDYYTRLERGNIRRAIAYAGAAGEAPPHAAGVSVISAPVVLPGLWDCHGHFAGVSTFDWRPWVTDPPALRGARCAHDLRAVLAAGVTSVREVGGLGVYLARVVDEGAARRSRDLRRRGGPDHDRRPRRRPRGG